MFAWTSSEDVWNYQPTNNQIVIYSSYNSYIHTIYIIIYIVMWCYMIYVSVRSVQSHRGWPPRLQLGSCTQDACGRPESMDWFKGKLKPEPPTCHGSIHGFRWRFSRLNQSIDRRIEETQDLIYFRWLVQTVFSKESSTVGTASKL